MQAGWARLHLKYLCSELLEVVFGVVAGVDQQFFVVVDIAEYGLAQEGRNDLLVVVVGGGVVDFDFFTLQDLVDHLHNLGSQGPGVFEHGHALLAGDHVLGVGDVAVLTGDDGPAELVNIVVVFQSVGDAQSGGVVGADPRVDLGAVRIVGGQDVFSALLGDVGLPGGGEALFRALPSVRCRQPRACFRSGN